MSLHAEGCLHHWHCWHHALIWPEGLVLISFLLQFYMTTGSKDVGLNDAWAVDWPTFCKGGEWELFITYYLEYAITPRIITQWGAAKVLGHHLEECTIFKDASMFYRYTWPMVKRWETQTFQFENASQAYKVWARVSFETCRSRHVAKKVGVV